MVAPLKTINAVPSDSVDHRVAVKDRISDGGGDTNDAIEVRSDLYSYDPNSYITMSVLSYDYDETTWSRTDPISASVLNSFSGDLFSFEKNVGVDDDSFSFGVIRSTSIEWSEVPSVPLPAGLPLLLAGLGVLGIAGRRRRR